MGAAALILLAIVPSAQGAQSPVSDRYDLYLAERARLDPNWASDAGLHAADDRLTRFDDATRAAFRKLVAEHLAALRAIDVAKLSTDDRLDATLWRSQLETELHDLDRRDEREIMPDLPLGAIQAIHSMLIKDYAPIEERARNARRRIAQIPDVFGDLRKTLKSPPRVWTEAAIEDGRGAAEAVPGLAEKARAGLPASEAAAFDRTVAAAKESIDSYVAFLEKEVLPRSTGKFAAGKDVYDFYLRTYHLLDLDADALIALGRREWKRTLELLEATAKEIHPTKPWTEILEGMKKDHPEPGKLLEAYRKVVAAARQFMIDRAIVTLPEGERLEIIETPAFERSQIPYAAYNPPAPLDSARTGHFYVTPVDPAAGPAEREAQMAGHNLYDIPGTVWHEAYPGHHTQFVVAKSVRSKVRALNSSPLLSEGWGFYCEELAHESGFFKDRRERLMQLNWRLQRAARVILDASLHSGRMTFGEAVDFLMKEVRLERPHAEGSVKAYTRRPAYFMAYMVGMLELVRIREAARARLGARFTLREFHDRVLRYGNVPPALIDRELVRDWK
jgi:uncharacterized protein (DUF885 family)